MKNIEVTNKIYKSFRKVWADNKDYRERFKNDSELLEHLIDIAAGEGFY